MTITAIVKVRMATPMSLEAARQRMHSVAPLFVDVPGLVRKTFLLDHANGYGGGAYTWVSREVAEAFYAGPWRKSILDTFGSEPEIQWFESPVIVDNEQGRIIASPGA